MPQQNLNSQSHSSSHPTGQTPKFLCFCCQSYPYLPPTTTTVHFSWLIDALSAHIIHLNLNTISYTHVEHSPNKTIYMKYYMETHTHTHTLTHSHTLTSPTFPVDLPVSMHTCCTRACLRVCACVCALWSKWMCIFEREKNICCSN